MPGPKPEMLDAIADIQRHIFNHGPTDFAKLREKYPVSDATWFRWLRAAKDQSPPPEILEAARQQLAERAASLSPEETTAAASAALTVAPAPEYIARSGPAGMENLNLLERLNQLYADAEMLRAYSLNSKGEIRMPMWFSNSVNLRDSLIGKAIKAVREVWDLTRQMEFCDSVLDEIQAESPACAARIVARLERLNAERGFTLNARP